MKIFFRRSQIFVVISIKKKTANPNSHGYCVCVLIQFKNKIPFDFSLRVHISKNTSYKELRVICIELLYIYFIFIFLGKFIVFLRIFFLNQCMIYLIYVSRVNKRGTKTLLEVVIIIHCALVNTDSFLSVGNAWSITVLSVL